MSRFDWHISHIRQEDRITVASPKTVVVYGSELRRLVTEYGHLLNTDSGENRTLVIWGDELLSEFVDATNSSRWKLEELAWLFGRFHATYIQAKDISLPGFRTAPAGLCEAYLRNGVMEKATEAIAGSQLALKSKQALVVEGLYINRYFDEVPHLINPAIVASHRACLDWARSPAALQAGVELRRSIDRLAWWGELSRYKFLLTPRSLGVQSSKAVEALLVLTVPIVQSVPAYDDLAALGFPLVVLDDWAQITGQRLQQWWDELAPRLQSFRHNCLTSAAYWGFLTGQLERCE